MAVAPYARTPVLGTNADAELGNQKLRWLPKIASAEAKIAVVVTEPDFGSDVAGSR